MPSAEATYTQTTSTFFPLLNVFQVWTFRSFTGSNCFFCSSITHSPFSHHYTISPTASEVFSTLFSNPTGCCIIHLSNQERRHCHALRF